MTNRPEESAALARLQAFAESGYFGEHQLTVEKIYLRGEYPDTQAVALFRLGAASETLYGWAHPVWDSEEADGLAAYLEMHLTEAALTRARTGDHALDENGVIWIPNFQDEF